MTMMKKEEGGSEGNLSKRQNKNNPTSNPEPQTESTNARSTAAGFGLFPPTCA